MKITVINGNARHENTWHCVEAFKSALLAYDEVETREFTLPRDMPFFCRGCFSCFYNGEQTCPDASYISPIVAAMEDADIIIFTSPAYGLDVSGQMKALLDHLCFMWASHRPNPKIFSKVGVILTTTSGMGAGRTAKTIKNSLDFWGVKRIYVFKKAVMAMKWKEVSEKNKADILKRAEKLAKKAAIAAGNIDRKPHSLKFRFIFSLMKGMQKKNDWNLTDRAHWESNGWLEGGNPLKG